MNHDQLMTIDQLATYLKASKSVIYLWVKQGTIPHVRFMKKLRFNPVDIEAWLQENAKQKKKGRGPHLQKG